MTGVPILTNITGFSARLVVEIAWGANLLASDTTWTWSDETANVMRDHGSGVTISPMGRSNETTQAQPAQCVFKLKNTTGAYTPYNPMASNWPNVAPGTPVRVRVSVDGGVTWAVRFQGYANGFPPSWDKSARVAVVTVTASGISRRLGQGSSPLRSAIYRAMSNASPVLYWPLEDGTSATSAATVVARQNAIYLNGVATFTADAPAGGAGSLSLGNAVASVAGHVVGNVNSTGTGAKFGFAFWVKGTTSGAGWQTPVVTLETDSADTYGWQVYVTDPSGGTNVCLSPIKIDGSVPYFVQVALRGNVLDGAWHLVWMTVEQTTATSVTITGTIDNQAGNFGSTSTYTIGHITGVRLGSNRYLTATGISSLQVSNLVVWNGSTSVLALGNSTAYQAGVGYVGETPGARMTRLSTEEGVPFSIVDFYETTQTMGPQGVDTYANLMHEAERTDNGFLYDGLSAGWRYQGISQRYDQATGFTLDMAQHHLLDLVPVDDDQRRRNRQRVDRKNGSFAEAQDATGPLGTGAIGEYKSQMTVNTADDTQLYNRANWEVWAGTVPGLRYPTLHPNLMRAPSLAASWLSRTDGVSGPVIPGCRIDVTNISTVATQHTSGTVSLVLEGYSEFISKEAWTVTLNCSQNRQYDVQKIGDANVGRINTDGAYLAAAASNGATSLTVATTAGMPLWTTTATYPADFPLNYNVDGLQVAVSGIASVATDGFTRTVSNGWGSADSGQAWTTSGGTAAAYSVGSGWGQMSLSAVATEYSTLLDVGSSDARAAIDVRFPVAAATGAAIRLRLGTRATDQNNLYYAQLELDTTGTMRLIIAKRVGGVSTTLSSNVVVGTNNANDWWHLEMASVGSTLTALGQDLTTPSGPQLLTLTDTAIASGTKVSALATLVTGYSGATPVTIAWDHFEVSNPQMFTVGALPRAVAAGKAVSLWNPGAIKF